MATNWKKEVSKHLLKVTPLAPFSWLTTLLRGLGHGESIDNLGNSVLGKYAGTSLTGAEREATDINIAEAQKTRDFEERMSNTTYQRTVADMKEAGLNPALLLTGASGVSTPSGSTAQAASPSGNSISDLLGLVTLPFQIANIAAQTNKTNIEANSEIPARIQQINAAIGVAESQIKNLDLDAEQKSIILPFIERQQEFYTASLGLNNEQIQQNINESVQRVANLKEENKKILQDISESQQRVSNLIAQQELTYAQIEEIAHTIKQIDANTSLLLKTGELTQKDINWYAANHIINPAANVLGSVIGATGNVIAKGAKAVGKFFGR